jgi:hypothetical protein
MFVQVSSSCGLKACNPGVVYLPGDDNRYNQYSEVASVKKMSLLIGIVKIVNL